MTPNALHEAVPEERLASGGTWFAAAVTISFVGACAAAALGFASAVGYGGADPISRVAALGVAIAWFGASAAGSAYYESRLKRGGATARLAVLVVALTQVFSIALVVAAVSRNLAVTWVALEATTMAGAFLVAYGDARRQALEAAWKFAVLAFAGVGFGLVGIGLIAASANGVTSSPTNIDSLAAVGTQLDPRLLSLGLSALFVGFGTKAGMFPLYWWLPDAHSQGPTPVSALMSGGLVATSLCVLVKVLAALHGLAIVPAFQYVLIGSGLAGLFVASFSMIDKRDSKRLLAFSTVEHIGVMAIAAGVGTPLALAAFTVHLLGHAAVKTSAFLSLGALVAHQGSRDVDDLAGSVARQPGAGSVFLVSVASLVGFPPSPLFVSELLLVFAAFQANMAWLAVLVSALLAVAFVAMTQYAVTVGLGPARRAKSGRGHRLSAAYTFFALVPVGLAIGLVLFRPQWAMSLIRLVTVAATGGAPW